MKASRKSVIFLLFGAWLCGCGPAGPELTLTRGIVVRESASFREGTYLIPGVKGTDAPVVIIRGREIVLDFRGATLQGSVSDGVEETFQGVGICIDQASKIVIRNVTVKGYHLGILCKSCEGLQLENVDLSGNSLPQEFTSLP